ncbi:serine-type peptidase [Aureococcus anophagefferens]|nr:serine-type peptidase [Aureococcus anophagefferens]
MASFGGGGGDLPYGSWPSPFTAKFITSSSVGLSNVKCDGDGGLWWQESRLQEGGRNVVVRRDAGAAGASERGAVEVTPADKNVRTRVHEYGGGAFCLGPGGAVVFSDFGSSGSTRRRAARRAVTAGDRKALRYADYAGYSFLPDGAVAAAYPDRATGRTVLHVVAPDGSSAVYDKDDGLPRRLRRRRPAPDGSLYLLGGGPDTPSGIFHWDPATKVGKKLASSSSADVPEGYVSVPKPVEFPRWARRTPTTTPANKDCSSSEAAPLLVKAHGGPTAHGPELQPGHPVLHVPRLRRSTWTTAGPRATAASTGAGSAGPGASSTSTTSARARRTSSTRASRTRSGWPSTAGPPAASRPSALAFKDVFTAGCSLYGVADLAALAGDTHKFESRYLDSLVGAYPADEAVYARAINAVDKLNCPILLLQGDEDKIVPLNQAQLMHEALLAKNILQAQGLRGRAARLPQGREHRGRAQLRAPSIPRSGFACAGDDITPFAIDNMA